MPEPDKSVRLGLFIGKYETPDGTCTIKVDRVPTFMVGSDSRLQRIVNQPIGQSVKNMITAHPRSGTRYISHMLTYLGIDMPHEVPGKDGIVSWQHICKGPWSVKCDNVIHLVRHPLMVIASSAYVLHESAFPFMMYVGGLNDYNIENPIERFMLTYVMWNELIEERAIWRFRLEDVNNNISELVTRLGFDYNTERLKSFNAFKHNVVNRKDHPVLTWDDLRNTNKKLYKKVKEMARRYGYER